MVNTLVEGAKNVEKTLVEGEFMGVKKTHIIGGVVVVIVLYMLMRTKSGFSNASASHSQHPQKSKTVLQLAREQLQLAREQAKQAVEAAKRALKAIKNTAK